MKKRRILIRTDGDEKKGLGHLMRSIAVANELRKRFKIDVSFASNPHPFLETQLKKEKYNVFLNKKDLCEEDFIEETAGRFKSEVIVIDTQYPYSLKYIKGIRRKTRVSLVENFCKGVFNANCVIFPSAHLSDEIINSEEWKKYKGEFLYGPEFVIINDNVKKMKKKNVIRSNNEKKHLLITTGGSDPEGVILKLFGWIAKDKEWQKIFNTIILTGELSAHYEKIEGIKKELPKNIKIKTFEYSALLDCDLVVCTFGVTAYELVYLGIPVLTVGHTRKTAQGACVLEQRYRVLTNLGYIGDIDEKMFKESVFLWLRDGMRKKGLLERQLSFLDGNGAQRIAEKIVTLR